MGRIKFVRVGNPFIAFLSIAIIALVLWLYVKCNPTPIQFRYNIISVPLKLGQVKY